MPLAQILLTDPYQELTSLCPLLMNWIMTVGWFAYPTEDGVTPSKVGAVINLPHEFTMT